MHKIKNHLAQLIIIKIQIKINNSNSSHSHWVRKMLIIVMEKIKIDNF